MSSALVRFEWFQTPTSITLVFFVKDRCGEDVKLEVHPLPSGLHSVEVTIDLRGLTTESGKEYQYAVSPLFAALAESAVADQRVVVKPMKIEVTLEKAVAFHWPSLEGREDTAATLATVPGLRAAVVPPPTVAPLPPAELKYPNSKGRDWSAFELSEEADEKPEGDAALQSLFQQIYGNGTDEQRKAMIKSFTESCGTVLSTNWEDVGKREVTVEPPTGMEPKKVTE